MIETSHLSRLNDLLVDLGRSLLQYAEEAWPWTSAFDSGEVRAVVRRLAAQQQQSVRALAEFLDIAGWSVDFGVYPDEYTSLHYVSLDYLLEQLVVNDESLIEECEQLARELAGDVEAVELLQEIARRERMALAELQSLVRR